MGRKVHPIGFRLKINKTWEARWFADGEDYVKNLHQDFELRDLVRSEASRAGVRMLQLTLGLLIQDEICHPACGGNVILD